MKKKFIVILLVLFALSISAVSAEGNFTEAQLNPQDGGGGTVLCFPSWK